MTPLSVGKFVLEEASKRKDSFVVAFETSSTMEEIHEKTNPMIEDLGKVVTNHIADTFKKCGVSAPDIEIALKMMGFKD